MKYCHVVCRITYKDMRACSVPLRVFYNDDENVSIAASSNYINKLIGDDKEVGAQADYTMYRIEYNGVLA